MKIDSSKYDEYLTINDTIDDYQNIQNVGLNLGDWKIERLIGYGTTANVYCVSNIHDTTQKRALKVIRVLKNNLSIEDYKKGKEESQNECKYMATLNSKYIVKCLHHDFKKLVNAQGKEVGYMALIYMDMYLCLRSYTPAIHSLLSIDEIIQLGFELSSAVKTFHDIGMAHRDIKIENIFIDRNGTIKLSDLGMARIVDSNPTLARGTQDYMSPELTSISPAYKKIANNQLEIRKIPFKSDIYAIGMVLYILLNNNRKPFQDENIPADTKYAIMMRNDPRIFNTKPIPKPKRGSKELHKIVFKCLAYYQNDRYDSIDELLNDIIKLKPSINNKSNNNGNNGNNVSNNSNSNNNLNSSKNGVINYRNYNEACRCIKSKDFQRAGKLFLMEANNNFYKAQYNYGVYLLLKQDYNGAYKYLKLASDNGFSNASYNIAIMLENNLIHSNDNLELAINYYKLASNSGHKKALHHLGYLYSNSYNNKSKAIETYLSNKDYAPSMYNASMLLWNIDINKALECLKISCNKNYTQALYVMACYQLKYNSVEAFNLFKRITSYDTRNANAQYNLALCYGKGIGTQKDFKEAINWLKKAKENNHEKARLILDELKMYKGTVSYGFI